MESFSLKEQSFITVQLAPACTANSHPRKVGCEHVYEHACLRNYTNAQIHVRKESLSLSVGISIHPKETKHFYPLFVANAHLILHFILYIFCFAYFFSLALQNPRSHRDAAVMCMKKQNKNNLWGKFHLSGKGFAAMFLLRAAETQRCF